MFALIEYCDECKAALTREVIHVCIDEESYMSPATEKAAKVPMYQGLIAYFPRALEEVAKVSAFGAMKHQTSFKERRFLGDDYPLEGYVDAIARHLKARAKEGDLNTQDENLYHLAQIAWDALAALEKTLIAKEINKFQKTWWGVDIDS